MGVTGILTTEKSSDKPMTGVRVRERSTSLESVGGESAVTGVIVAEREKTRRKIAMKGARVSNGELDKRANSL
ncbi:MAG: hypothetical protein LBL84_01125 [Candidatus Nomurabacteria bacterium]|nr:hypothetical protein [Candidatus Nomurabacteria bacterium]